jgi:hypothetical protein
MDEGSTAFLSANPHALEAIVTAGDRCEIVASQDIYDDRGQKLWAQGQPVSRSLQERLLERKLKQPLEACLQARDGVGVPALLTALQAFLDGGQPLAKPLRAYGVTLSDEAAQLPLHAVAQLLLTAAQATKPAMIEHAVQAMALSGAMALAAGAETYDLRLAMLGGLLHDLGEMYVNPTYLDPKAALEAHDYRHVIVHPRVGDMLLRTQTDYPPALARAVGEHHERLGGTGYPDRKTASALSDLGKQLAVVEVVLGIASSSPAPWVHAGFALKLVPGEFDRASVGFVTRLARTAGEDLAFAANGSLRSVPQELTFKEERLGIAAKFARTLAHKPTGRPMVRSVAQRAEQLLDRLQMSWNAMGLWSVAVDDLPDDARFELHMACRELKYRLQDVRREALWPEADAAAAAREPELQPLWQALRIDGAPH